MAEDELVVEEMLDRFYASVEWSLLFPDASIVNIDSDIFGRRRILLKCYATKTKSPKDMRLLHIEKCGPWSQLVWM